MSTKSSTTTTPSSKPKATKLAAPKANKASSAADDADQLQELIDLLRQPSLTDASAVAAGAPSNSRTLSSGSAASKNIPPSSLAPSNDSQPAPSSSPSPHLVSSGSGANLTGTTSGGSARTKRSKNLEETRLDAFLLKHSKRYEFSTDAYSKLLSQLVESRLLNAEWERQASREHRLRVLRAIRVLSRDPALQEQFLRYRPLGTLAAALHRYTREYFDSEPPYAAESVVEVCSILKRVSSEATQDKRIFEQPLFLRSLVLLLSARDHAVLQAVLVTLVNLSGSQMFVEKAMELPMIEPLLHLLNEFSSAQGVQTPLASSGAPTSSNTLPGASPSPSSGPAASASPFAHSQPLAGAAGAGRIGTPASNPVLPNAALPASSPPASSAATSAAAVSQSYHFLAAELLDLLTEYRECRQEIHLLSGNAVFLRLLHRSLSTASSSSVATPSPSSSSASTTSSVAPPPHEQVLLPVLRCLANQALEPESSREIRVLGGIQLLLGMLNTDSTSSGNRSSSPPLSDALLISACICLTQLALEDENALNMRKSGGVYLLGMLFLKGSPTAAQQQQNQQQQEKASAANNPHPPVYSRDVQSHACRALRFLYSHERNRQLFKRLFPSLPDLFACFIDVGHYVHALEEYEKVVDMLNESPPAGKQAMLAAFEGLRTNLAGFHVGSAGSNNTGGALASSNSAIPSLTSYPSSSSSSLSVPGGTPSPPIIRGYILQEVLGRGAFGTVYQVQRESGDKLYAMKELSLREMQKAGAIGIPGGNNNARGGGGDPTTTGETVKQAASELGKEIDILSQLDHPNIVRYYTSFLEGPSVYIVMELVDGSSLLDHINSWVEKGVQMAEESIWPIFIQLCLALCYMHMEKRVVHRDLTPSNIMISDEKVVKVTDFGLARQTHNGTVLQSAVGTISFSCPEIVMHESYTDKADIWSLGCILYQMATGKPAFAGSNPLTVAQKIVAGSYSPLPSTYSPLFHEMVRRLLTVDPQARPDILAVSSLISPLLMAELDRVNISSDRLVQQLAHSEERHRREKEEWMREKQIWRKWMANTAHAHTQQRSMSGNGGGPLGSSGSNSNLQNGFDGEPSSAAATPANSSSTDYPDDPSSNLHPPTSSPLFRVSTSQLRPTSHDPLTLLLSQLHKIVHISQLPPKAQRDLKRSVIVKYKQSLFARPWNPAEFKRELQQVVSGSQDFIDPSFELPHLDAAALLTSPHQASSASVAASGASSTAGASGLAHSLTHEDLQLMIEQVLEEVGYYAQQKGAAGGASATAAAHGGENARQRSREE